MAHGILLSSSGEIDVMVHGIVKYSVFGHEAWITTTHVSLLIVMIILIIFSIAAGQVMKHATEVPGTFQNIVEMIVERLDGMVDNSMGKFGKKYRNYIGTIFIFILFCNLSGLIGLRSPTADYGVTLPLGVVTFFLIRYNQVKYQKPAEIWGSLTSPLPRWLPLWVPINLISDLAVPISLSLRLFANVLSGTIMLTLVYGLLGWFATIWPAALHVYFDVFAGAIQTYVFCMLTMTYVSNEMRE